MLWHKQALRTGPVVFCCVANYCKTQWLSKNHLILFIILWVRNLGRVHMGSLSLIHMAAGPGGLISKVVPSPTRLRLGSPWPPSPHAACQASGPLLGAWAFYVMAQDSKHQCAGWQVEAASLH